MNKPCTLIGIALALLLAGCESAPAQREAGPAPAATVAVVSEPVASGWLDQTPPNFGLMQDGVFLSPLVGVITGPKTWRTADGGRTWNEVCAQGFWSLSFVDSQVGFASGGGWGGPPGLVYKTVDGGQTWTQVFSGPLGLMAVAAGDREHVVAGSPWRSDSLWVSVDGGATWAERHGAGADIHGLLAVGAREFYALGLDGRLGHSSDGGTTWTRRCTFPGKRNHDGGLLRLEGGALLAAFSGGLQRSDDGGRTFTPMAGAPAGSRRLGHGPGGRLGLVAEGGIWESADAGRSWKQAYATSLTVNALSRAGDTWWAVGGKFGGYNFGQVSLLLRQGPPRTESDPGRIIPIACAIPAAGQATVVVEDAQGVRVRNLVAEEPVVPGTRTLWWDGRDDWGDPVPPGTYRWRGLFHPGLHVEYGFAFNTPADPPWNDGRGGGGWTSDHNLPQAVAARGGRVFLGCPAAENGNRVIAIDAASGRKLWHQTRRLALGNHYGGPATALAADDEHVYVALQTPEGGIGICRLGLADGVEVPFAALPDDKDKRVVDRVLLAKPAGAPAPLDWIATAQARAWDSGTAGGSLRGCAVDASRVYVSSYWDDAVLVADKRSGALLRTLRVPRPAGLACAGDGRLLAISGTTVVAVGVEDGALAPLATGLTAPMGLAVGADGTLLVSQRGAAMQVAAFDAAGRPLRRIGRDGGRAASGPYQSDGMLMPRGVAVDGAGRLWVAEEDFAPRRFSAWSADGRLERELIGGSTYAATGASVDPDQPERAIDTGTIFQLDWAAGSGRPVYSLPRQGTVPGALVGWPYPGDHGAPHGRARFLRVQGRQFLLREELPVTVYELVDGRWLARAAAGTLHDAFLGQIRHQGFDARILAVLPGHDPATWTWPIPRSLPDRAFLWCDANGDGLVQTAEVEAGDPGPASWKSLAPRFTDDLGLVLGAHLLPRAEWTACGAPRWRLADVRQAATPATVHPNGWDTRLRTPAGWLIVDGYRPRWGAGDGGGFPGMLSGYAPDGRRRWTYPSWFQVHGSHKAPSPRPGQLAGDWYFGGQVDLGGELGEVVHVMGNLGRHYLFTADGLFIAGLFRDGRSGPELPRTVARGQRIDGMSNESEGWAAGFFRHPASGRVHVVSCPAKSSGPVISEVLGLDAVRRLPGGTLTVTPAQAQRASELAAATVDGALAPLRIAAAATAPAIDGRLDDWRMEQGVGIPVDDQRGARVALRRDATHLYLAYEVRDPNRFANGGDDPRLLFKSGASVDLMLGTDPAASPGRTQPVAGDLRLLLAAPGGKPVAVLYRPVAPGAGDGTSFSSPNCRVSFDSVRVLAEARLALQRTPAGVVIEAAVPLAALGWTPKPGSELRGDVGVIYGDEQGSRNLQRTYWSNRSAGLVSDVGEESRLVPNQWGRVVVEK
ncbi:MAG: hypothetical protein L6R48_05665 [Planctomycetes bacterium]|nr:hypothetical protein [Planctomycetota bacterium]